jgi:hypothetical protein
MLGEHLVDVRTWDFRPPSSPLVATSARWPCAILDKPTRSVRPLATHAHIIGHYRLAPILSGSQACCNLATLMLCRPLP